MSVSYQVTLTLWHKEAATVNVECEGETTQCPLKSFDKNMCSNQQPFQSHVFRTVQWTLNSTTKH
jgi:hypothetical protein